MVGDETVLSPAVIAATRDDRIERASAYQFLKAIDRALEIGLGWGPLVCFMGWGGS